MYFYLYNNVKHNAVVSVSELFVIYSRNLKFGRYSRMTDVHLEMGDVSENQPLINQHSRTNSHLNNEAIGDHLKNLLKAVLNNNETRIKDIIEVYPEKAESLEDDLRYHRYKYELDGKERFDSILIFACISQEVEAKTLGILCEQLKSKYGDVQYTNEMWFGWEPIHYVASTANPKKLETLLNVLKVDVNSLTYFSENALHILLQYDKSAIPYGVVLHNSRESRSTTIIGTEKKALHECANILINEGIDVNQTNFWNETPICLAVRYRYTDLINLLLTVDYIDLDSFKESGKTIREYLKWNLYISKPKSYVQEDPVRIRFNFLKSGDEENFLTYCPDTLSDNVNSCDTDNEDSFTMLQFCLRKGFLEYLQDDHYKIRRLNSYDIKDSPMLAVFKTKGLGRCIIYLLDNGADTSMTTRKFKESVLEYAALRGYYPFVSILLQHKNSKITVDDIFDVLSKIPHINFDLKHRDFYRYCVLYILLNKLIFLTRQNRESSKEQHNERTSEKIDILTPKRQNILNNLLYKLNLECDDKKNDDSEIIYQILRLGGNLTYTSGNKELVVQRLDQSLLKSHFDDSIQGTTFKYDSIIKDDNKVYNENKTLHFLVTDNKKQKLLTHPLLIELIREKWSKIKWVFYADLLFYTLLMSGIYWYTVYDHFEKPMGFIYICYWFFIGFHVFKESIQFLFLYRWKYFCESSNILETTTIICCLITICLPNIYTSVASILSSTFIFFLLLGQIPFFTKYTIIFSSIKYFFQYMAFYSIQFVAFSICFYLICPFKNESNSTDLNTTLSSNDTGPVNNTGPSWEDIAKSLFYTLIYFTGEFNERVLEPEVYPLFGRVIMTVFIFCMTIILNNLLVGLIVADMENIQQTGRLYKEIKLTRFIQSTNTFIKRMHRFKYIKFIKKMIYYTDVFKRGKEKVFKNVDYLKFDEENKKYLKKIKNIQIFDRHMLRDVYNEVTKKVN